jgi:hypothetical protein
MGENHEAHHKDVKSFCLRPVFLLVLFLLFTAIIAVSFQLYKDNAAKGYALANQESPAIRNYGSPQKPLDVFMKYGLYMAIALGLIALALSYLLYGIAALFGFSKAKYSVLVVSLISYGLLLTLGTELSYLENRNTTVGNAIIFFIGHPLFYASLAIVIITVAALSFRIVKRQ